VEQLTPDFAPGSFDAVVCADVLERLREPAALLGRVRGWLKRDGCLVASVPNVRHHSVVRSLLAGNWTYEPAGLLGRTHLRFFTRREIEKCFYRAGFTIQEMRAVPGPGDRDWQASAAAGEVRMGRLHVGGLPPTEAEEFYAYQYLVHAVPADVPDHGLMSIVIVSHNQLEYTRLSMDSVRQYTDEPYELIVVDNASTDGTPAHLERLGGVRVIRNEENRGFPAAASCSFRASSRCHCA
jgi:hypothetical protein